MGNPGLTGTVVIPFSPSLGREVTVQGHTEPTALTAVLG